MSEPLELRRYWIDFFQIDHVATPQFPSVVDGFNSILDRSLAPIFNLGGYTRDIHRPIQRTSPLPRSYAGQFRKFRTSDLPEIGAAGEDAQALELAENQGLVERNFFVFYPEHNVLGWCRNGHGNTAMQFGSFLGNLWGTRVTLNPILQPDAVHRFMRGEVQLKRLEITIPRPTNPDMYPDDDYSRATMELMNSAGADSLHLVMGIDTRRKDTEGTLKAHWKHTLARLSGMASTAKAVVYDDGIEHPIDLIADRISSPQDIETNARFPPAATLYAAIDTAREECRGAIHDYFGSLGTALR
jgi:hypothetical protein